MARARIAPQQTTPACMLGEICDCRGRIKQLPHLGIRSEAESLKSIAYGVVRAGGLGLRGLREP